MHTLKASIFSIKNSERQAFTSITFKKNSLNWQGHAYSRQTRVLARADAPLLHGANAGSQLRVQAQGQNREMAKATPRENSEEPNLWASLNKYNTSSNVENRREYSYLEAGHSGHEDRGSKRETEQ